MNDYFSVRSFGAIGNGVANDTAAIKLAIAALPAAGGTIYFPPGTYLVTDTLSWGDLDIEFNFSAGAKIITTGLGAKPLFKINTGLTMERFTVFTYLRAVGENNAGAQYLLEVADAGGFAKVEMTSPDIRGFRRVFNISAGDINYLESVRIFINGGIFVPTTADGTSIFVSTTGTYAQNLYPSGLHMVGVNCFDEQNQINAWHFDCDSEMILINSRLDLTGANQISGLSMSSETRIYGFEALGATSIRAAGGSDQATLGGAKFWLSHIQLILDDESVIAGAMLTFRAKIICASAHGDRHTLSSIVQQVNPFAGDPDAVIEIIGGATVVSITDCVLSRASEALIKNASPIGPTITGCQFIAEGATNTIKDTGAGDFTLGVGNKGVSTGGGLALAVNSKVTIGDYNFA